MEQILNYRILASGMENGEGKQIRGIYRSADVSSASKQDIEDMIAANIVNIIDLRSAQEITTLIEDERITIKNIDIIGHGKQNQVDLFSIPDLTKIMIELYEKSFVESDGFKQELDHILSLNGQNFLFHCTAGKDRTGITAAILMHLLGFSYEQIMDEYLMIDETLVNFIMNKVVTQFDQQDIDIDIASVKAVASVTEGFLEAYVLGITDRYGTVDNYLEVKLGITSEKIELLKNHYLV